jgi:DNA-binding GntR family transcriptional regulator
VVSTSARSSHLSAGVEAACEAVRRAIQDGRYAGGARITEAEVCAMAQVSRSCVRQALTLLAAEGFLELRANRGAVVVDWTDANLLEVFDLRALLEGHGCALAARNATAAEIEALRSEARIFESLCHAPQIDLRAVAESNNRFHRLLLDTGRNRRVAALLAAVVHMPLERMTFARYDDATFMRSASQHHELVDAVAAADPIWAEAAMRAHIHGAKATIFRCVSEPGGPAPVDRPAHARRTRRSSTPPDPSVVRASAPRTN